MTPAGNAYKWAQVTDGTDTDITATLASGALAGRGIPASGDVT
jgi:hypothetical protein